MPRYINACLYIKYLSELKEIVRKHYLFEEAGELQRGINQIKNFPAADVAPVVHGEWEKKYDTLSQDYNSDNNWYHVCSACQKGSQYDTAYCPNCGAKMDGGKK